MAKTRKINNALTRTLDQSSSIVYVVSDEMTLSYANQACADWVGVNLDELVGTNLIYTTEPLDDAAEEAAKGLAIVPKLIASPEVNDSFGVQIFAKSNQEIRSRSAMASAIFDHRGVLSGYLIVGAAQDEPPAEVNIRKAIDLPAKLHNALVLVRQIHQKRFNSIRLVGTSVAAERVRRQIQSAVDSNSDVLIVGPEGSGREHVARTVFNSQFSNVADSANLPGDEHPHLVPLHCSITDPFQVQSTMKELLESSVDPTTGGEDPVTATLLLINVDQLDAGSQQELLGYLQLPGMSVRTIATASTQLIGANANFDQTLASHLSTIVVELPALADRKEDLPLLAQAILESKNDQQAKQFSGFTRQAIEQICEYDWPGNFGQLASAIAAATSNATGSIIQVLDFAEVFHHSIQAQRFAVTKESKIELDEYLLDVESQLIERAIKQADGNKTKAAELLGISRAKLLRRLKHFQSSEEEIEFQPIEEPVFQEEPEDA